MADNKKTLLYIGAAVLGGFVLMKLFGKSSKPGGGKNQTTPGGHVNTPPPGSTTDSLGNIFNSLGKWIGQLSGAQGGKSGSGAAPSLSSGGAQGANGGANPGAGPIGNSAPAPKNGDGSPITYADGSKIDQNNNYVDSNGNVIGYVGADGNLYANDGSLIGDISAGSDGNPDKTPNAQAVYADGSYIDNNGYYHDSDGSLAGWAGTDGMMHDNDGNIIGTLDETGAGPDLQGAPVDQGNGYDQYNDPVQGSLGDPVAQSDGFDQYGDPAGDPVDQGDGYDQYGDPYQGA